MLSNDKKAKCQREEFSQHISLNLQSTVGTHISLVGHCAGRKFLGGLAFFQLYTQEGVIQVVLNSRETIENLTMIPDNAPLFVDGIVQKKVQREPAELPVYEILASRVISASLNKENFPGVEFGDYADSKTYFSRVAKNRNEIILYNKARKVLHAGNLVEVDAPDHVSFEDAQGALAICRGKYIDDISIATSYLPFLSYSRALAIAGMQQFFFFTPRASKWPSLLHIGMCFSSCEQLLQILSRLLCGIESSIGLSVASSRLKNATTMKYEDARQRWVKEKLNFSNEHCAIWIEEFPSVVFNEKGKRCGPGAYCKPLDCNNNHKLAFQSFASDRKCLYLNGLAIACYAGISNSVRDGTALASVLTSDAASNAEWVKLLCKGMSPSIPPLGILTVSFANLLCALENKIGDQKVLRCNDEIQGIFDKQRAWTTNTSIITTDLISQQKLSIAHLEREELMLACLELNRAADSSIAPDVPVERMLATKNGTKSLENFYPPDNADIIKCMFNQGATLLGKTRLHELSYGWTCISEIHGNVLNPHDIARIPGGSSGGGAVSVASGMAPLAIVEDTLGSLRIPASMCGVIGYRPTFGRYSNAGILALTQDRFDQVGVIARSVEDVLLWDRAVTGVAIAPDIGSVAGTRVAICPDYTFGPAEAEVGSVCNEALYRLASAGAELVWSESPKLMRYAAVAARTIILFETQVAIENFLKNNRVDMGFEELVCKLEKETQRIFKDAVWENARPSVQAYQRAIRQCADLRDSLIRLFRENTVDIMAFPAALICAPTFAEVLSHASYASDISFEEAMTHNTSLATCAGLASVVINVGATKTGLPIGLEIVALPGEDRKLLAFCQQAEALFDRISISALMARVFKQIEGGLLRI